MKKHIPYAVVSFILFTLLSSLFFILESDTASWNFFCLPVVFFLCSLPKVLFASQNAFFPNDAENSSAGLAFLDKELHIVDCNSAFQAICDMATSPVQKTLSQTCPHIDAVTLQNIQKASSGSSLALPFGNSELPQIYTCCIIHHQSQGKNYTLLCINDLHDILTAVEVPQSNLNNLTHKYLTLLSQNAELHLGIAEQSAITQALRRSESRYRNICDNASEGIFQWTINGRLIWANITFAHMLGFDTVNNLLEHFSHEPFAFAAEEKEHDAFLELLEKQAFLTNHEILITRLNKTNMWANINARRVCNQNGITNYYEAFIENISNRKNAEEKLLFQAFHDPLTGLANRTLFSDRLAATLRRALRQRNQRFSVLFIDLDHFKQVNDSYGHHIGDLVLKYASRQIMECIRESDTVARFGGDEFGIILDNPIDDNAVIMVAERILVALNTPIHINNHSIQIGSSIGIVMHAHNYTNIDTLLSDADSAMYWAKTEKRNSIQIFTLEISSAQKGKEASTTRIKEAFDLREFYLEYQPIVDITQPSFFAFEALVRWKKNNEMMMPKDFLAAIMKAGCAERLDMYIIDLVCRHISEWLPLTKKPFTIHINIASNKLDSPQFYQQVTSIIEKYHVPPHYICFEFSENSLLSNNFTDLHQIKMYHDLGFKLCLENFGTTVSSLSSLLNFPLSFAKISGDFITSMDGTKQSELVSRYLFDLGNRLGINFVAVGVERKEQEVLLRQAGCCVLQGFLFSHPLSAKDIPAHLP